MKKIIALILFIPASLLVASDEGLKDISILEKQRLAEIDKINEAYLKKLEDLKSIYMRREDLDSANKVQEKINSLKSNKGEAKNIDPDDSQWTWGSGGILTLQKNGVARHTGWGHSSGKWRKYNDGSMKITVGSRVFKVEFTDDMQGQVTDDKTGAKTTITRRK